MFYCKRFALLMYGKMYMSQFYCFTKTSAKGGFQISHCDKHELRISFLTAPLRDGGPEEQRTWHRGWVSIVNLAVCFLRFECNRKFKVSNNNADFLNSTKEPCCHPLSKLANTKFAVNKDISLYGMHTIDCQCNTN